MLITQNSLLPLLLPVAVAATLAAALAAADDYDVAVVLR